MRQINMSNKLSIPIKDFLFLKRPKGKGNLSFKSLIKRDILPFAAGP